MQDEEDEEVKNEDNEENEEELLDIVKEKSKFLEAAVVQS